MHLTYRKYKSDKYLTDVKNKKSNILTSCVLCVVYVCVMFNGSKTEWKMPQFDIYDDILSFCAFLKLLGLKPGL
jgi:hypothetical protein